MRSALHYLYFFFNLIFEQPKKLNFVREIKKNQKKKKSYYTCSMEIEKTKKGTIIELNGRLYIRGGFNRELKKYEIQSYDNISKFKYVKKGTLVEII